MGILVDATLNTFANPPVYTDLTDKDVTAWFISKWPHHMNEIFSKLAEERQFLLEDLITAILDYDEQSPTIVKLHQGMAITEHRFTSDRQPIKQYVPQENTRQTRRQISRKSPLKSKTAKDFRTRNNLPDKSHDLPEELSKDKELCKIYDETNVVADVCFKCGSHDHHSSKCPKSSPTPEEKAKGDKIAKAYKKVLDWVKSHPT